MLRGHVPGTCCSHTSPRVSSYFYFRATTILPQFCPHDMSHDVQLVELCGTCCRDKTLQGCNVPSCARLCNMFLQQNQQTTTRCVRALALGKNPSIFKELAVENKHAQFVALFEQIAPFVTKQGSQ